MFLGDKKFGQHKYLCVKFFPRGNLTSFDKNGCPFYSILFTFDLEIFQKLSKIKILLKMEKTKGTIIIKPLK